MIRMNRMMFVSCFAGALLLSSAFAADPPKGEEGGMDPAQMEAWTKSMTPGDHHKAMDFFVGDWTSKNTMWMDGQEMKSESTMHAEWALGGRYLIETHKGDFGGMPFEGMGLSGFDNSTGEHFNVWIDNMGTGMMVSRGACTDHCKSTTTTGTMKDAMSGQMMDHKMLSSVLGPDSFKFEMWMTPQGAPAEMKVMEAVYTRVKKS